MRVHFFYEILLLNRHGDAFVILNTFKEMQPGIWHELALGMNKAGDCYDYTHQETVLLAPDPLPALLPSQVLYWLMMFRKYTQP